ncbi:hypothetical protein G6F24_014576 [Rhizopus arrhizus]|nr:hypothetical protein G6F24_014576 [Rhizopus arrhizus]
MAVSRSPSSMARPPSPDNESTCRPVNAFCRPSACGIALAIAPCNRLVSRVVRRVFGQQRRQVLWMDQLALARLLFLFALLQRLVAALDAFVQETAVLARRQHRQQGVQRRRDVTDHAQVHRMAAAQMAAVAVDLDDRGLVRIELAPREIGTEQQQRVALHQRVEARLDAEDPGHALVDGVVGLDEILGARGVRDRRLQAPRQFQQLRVCALAARAGIDADAPALPQQLGDALQFCIGRAQHRLGSPPPRRGG